MPIAEICTLPVETLAEADGAHLYLWTTNRFLPDAFAVAEAWGFTFSTLIVWCKKPMGRGVGLPAWPVFTEYVLFCRRGTLRATRQAERNWYEWNRGGPSVKPEAFIDLVEQVSPGPYVELFSRRHRLGWDVWGNESANTAEMPV
jgi:N6-adenosine-specific RNA methylase IME4